MDQSPGALFSGENQYSAVKQRGRENRGPSDIAPKSFSFLSLVFWICLVNSYEGISLVSLLFSLSFPRILWVRQLQEILGMFEVLLDKNPPK